MCCLLTSRKQSVCLTLTVFATCKQTGNLSSWLTRIYLSNLAIASKLYIRFPTAPKAAGIPLLPPCGDTR